MEGENETHRVCFELAIDHDYQGDCPDRDHEVHQGLILLTVGKKRAY